MSDSNQDKPVVSLVSELWAIGSSLHQMDADNLEELESKLAKKLKKSKSEMPTVKAIIRLINMAKVVQPYVQNIDYDLQKKYREADESV